MRKDLFISLLIVLNNSLIFSQTINIHSVSTMRQIGFDMGYTLDGDHMASSRAKLNNPENFGESGIYTKNVTIFSAYYTSGSLEQITTTEGIDIFFFGSFLAESGNLIPFTQSEIDSLYAWSLRGGKLIIAEQYPPGSSRYQHLGRKWGYHFTWQQTSYIIPVENAKNNLIFNGPFGVVDMANMGGSAQGTLEIPSGDFAVLGTNPTGHSTLVIDCHTRDLIIADVDAYTDLGGLSTGHQIINTQDRFWANTIAFMDNLGDKPPPAVIQYDGTNLYTDEYNRYQWILNWDLMEGTDTSAITPESDGYYQVVVADEIGCMDTSDIFVYGMPLEPLIQCPGDITVNTDPGVNYATLTLGQPKVFDPDGIASVQNDAPEHFTVGRTTVQWTVTDSAGYTSNCYQMITVNDVEKPTIFCPSTIYIPTDPGMNYATITLSEPVTADNVFVSSVANNAPDVFPFGTSWVTWVAYDSSGNSRSCIQYVTVTDNENPVIICPPDVNDTLASGLMRMQVDLGRESVTDNVGLTSVYNDAPNEFPAGSFVVTWVAVDQSGNQSTCEQMIHITGPEDVPVKKLHIPNIITPNGDGLNDFFVIENLQEFSELIIFDRTDKTLFKSDNYLNNWYGTDISGNPLESGTYWYYLKTQGGEQYSGYVIVQRN